MKRNKHSLSHYKLATLDMGKLIPVGLVECLPGDTIQHSTSLLMRLSPLVSPVMHPVTVRLHHWFVPNRLVYSGWEDFITGGKDGTGSTVPYPTNVNQIPGSAVAQSILDYFGIPLADHPIGTISMIPVRGYNKIYNEFYRDEDLVPERNLDLIDVPRIAWEKDYFTAARPWAQKGPQVTIPLGLSAPVKTSVADQVTGAQAALRGRLSQDGTLPTGGTPLHWQTGTGTIGGDQAPGGTFGTGMYPSNLWADLEQAQSPDIIEFRRAFAIQRYQEARAQYGSRYTEYLRYLGVRSSDARLQRPEYLGGGKQTISFSEVLKTGSGEDPAEPIGTMKGHGIAAMRSNRYRYFCEEHGYVFTLLSVRPRSIYIDGMPRTFSKRNKEEYWQKELELIGQQEIFNRELFVEGTSEDDEIFGYQDRYSEYRHQYSNVAGEFRNLLDYWHLARKFTTTPVLNQSFIECDPTKRIFAEQTQNSLWCMISHSIQARRMVGNKTIGRII